MAIDTLADKQYMRSACQGSERCDTDKLWKQGRIFTLLDEGSVGNGVVNTLLEMFREPFTDLLLLCKMQILYSQHTRSSCLVPAVSPPDPLSSESQEPEFSGLCPQAALSPGFPLGLSKESKNSRMKGRKMKTSEFLFLCLPPVGL